MTNDAFDALRADTSPIEPSPAFASRLHGDLVARLEQQMTEPDLGILNTGTPYLVVDGAAAAIEFYVNAFGAVEHHRLVGDDGRVGHAELVFGNSRIMLADEYPEVGAISPTTRGGTSTSFTFAVPDVDVVFARAIAMGATELRPVEDQFYGHRQGFLRDQWGHQWGISSPLADIDNEQYAANSREAGYEWQPTEAAIATDAASDEPHDHQVKHLSQGDLYYFTLPTADLAKAQAFYGAVLGWQFPDPENGHIGNISAPPGSAHGATGVTDLYFVVDDIHAAVAAVRAHGGTADEPVHYDSGWAAQCTDDQGVRFHISVPADKYRT
jgi:uncharacterized glyoxalase superfamily protein PhnB/predicted enzyme related to lactoylglutathione lyase